MCLLLLGSLIFYSQLAVAGLRLAVCWADRHNHILQFSSLITQTQSCFRGAVRVLKNSKKEQVPVHKDC